MFNISNTGHIIVYLIVGVIHELTPQNNSAIERRRMILPKIVGYFKMNSAKYINECRGIQGASVWQRNYFEHIIRPGKPFDKIRNYIFCNAVKWESDLENLEFVKNLSEEEINKKIVEEYKEILI